MTGEAITDSTSGTMSTRRAFVRGALVAAGVAVAGGSLLRATLAGAGQAAPGVGPYGPLATTPDANGLFLPAGFTSRLVATTGQAVAGTGYVWHAAPDGGACFPVPEGGWVYVSNSEVADAGGGVSAIRFAPDGAVVAAYRILAGTSRNCAGGLTAAGRWFSCEENGVGGRVYECDPLRPGQGVMRPALGAFNHEAAFEDPLTGHVYLTEDDPNGRLYRFVPAVRGDFSAGQLSAAKVTAGALTWVPVAADRPERSGATTGFNGGEGLWIEGRRMYVTTKGDRRVWEIDLDRQRLDLLCDGGTPGVPLDAVDNCTVLGPTGDVFVCEDGGNMEVCVISRGAGGLPQVAPFLRIAGHASSEWCGVAFSPDNTRMYLSSQRGSDGVTGRTYEIRGPFLGAAGATDVLLPAGSVWRYRDTGGDPGAAWRMPGFDDGAWGSGAAPLGYGDPVATTVGFGPDAANKHITTYFRRTFEVTSGYASLLVRLRRDDGAVVHLDGVEVLRSNMPAGVVGPSTLAASILNEPDESRLVDLPVAVALAPGRHVLAVEVHQSAPASSDMSFDLALHGVGRVTPPTTTTMPPTTTVPPTVPPTTVPPTTVPPGAATVLAVTADAHVRDGADEARNFGSASVGEVRATTRVGQTRWYYAQVDTAAHQGTVGRAVLRMRVAGVDGVRNDIEVLATSAAWSASTVTWATRPQPAGAALATTAVTGGAATWYELDVTGHVRAERAAGRTAVSFVVRMVTASGVVLTLPTAEWADAAARPQLVITR